MDRAGPEQAGDRTGTALAVERREPDEHWPHFGDGVDAFFGSEP